MILAHISNDQTTGMLRRYPALSRAIDWIEKKAEDATNGIVELQGEQLYVNVHGYTTQPRVDCPWESHRRTVDLQYCIEGCELIDWTAAVPAVASVSYDPKKDFEFWPDHIVSANTIHLTAGMFVIFLPGELHRPMVANDEPLPIRKLVVKISANLLFPDDRDVSFSLP